MLIIPTIAAKNRDVANVFTALAGVLKFPKLYSWSESYLRHHHLMAHSTTNSYHCDLLAG